MMFQQGKTLTRTQHFDPSTAGGTQTMRHPTFWKLTNLKDGSRHLLLGTLHSGFRFNDIFPSKFLDILDEATVLIGEVQYKDESAEKVKPSFCPVLRHVQQRKYNMRKILGKYRFKELQAIHKDGPSDTPHVNLAHIGLESAIESDDLGRIIYYLKDLGTHEAVPLLGIRIDQPVILDRQIPERAANSSRDKSFLGLESIEDMLSCSDKYYHTAASALAYHDPKFEWGVDRIREWIDKIGIAGESQRIARWFDDYVKGRLMPYLSPLHWWRPSFVNQKWAFELIDKRNKAWIDTGKIQNSCVKGHKCLIYVGGSHVYYYRLPLTTLIRQEGFSVEPLTPDQFLKFNF